MSTMSDMRIPDSIKRMEITKLKNGENIWGASINLFLGDYKGVFNVSKFNMTPEIFKILDLVDHRVEKVTTKGKEEELFVKGSPLVGLNEPQKLEHLFKLISNFGIDNTTSSPLIHSMSKGVAIKLMSISIKGKKQYAHVNVVSRENEPIKELIGEFSKQNVKMVQSRQGRTLEGGLTEYPFKVSLQALFRIVGSKGYILRVPSDVIVFNYDNQTRRYPTVSTAFVGKQLVMVKENPDKVSDEVYDWVGGALKWGLMLENLRVRGSLVYGNNDR